MIIIIMNFSRVLVNIKENNYVNSLKRIDSVNSYPSFPVKLERYYAA